MPPGKPPGPNPLWPVPPYSAIPAPPVGLAPRPPSFGSGTAKKRLSSSLLGARGCKHTEPGASPLRMNTTWKVAICPREGEVRSKAPRGQPHPTRRYIRSRSPPEERPASSRAGFHSAGAAQPFGSPPGTELALLSVVSAVSLLARMRSPAELVGPGNDRGPPKQASCPPTEVRGSLPGEFLKQFIPFARDVSGGHAQTEQVLPAKAGESPNHPSWGAQRTIPSTI